MISFSIPMNLIPFIYNSFPRLTYWGFRFSKANYEKEMEFLDLLCDPRKLSLDIGAKVGMYTYRLLKHSREVWAFEPIPLLANILQKTFSGRVRVESVALSDRAGQSILRVPYWDQGFPKYGLSTIAQENTLASPELKTIQNLEIETKRLDDYALHNIGFIKIDVEGHEMAVLRGARELIQNSKIMKLNVWVPNQKK